MLVTGLMLLGLCLVPNSSASAMDKKTILTFSQPVQIPGAVLESGTYVVKRVDWGNPNILRFWNHDETKIHATLMAIPVERSRPSENVEVTFYETRGSTPPAVRDIFYPGEITGEQFLYPKGGPVLMALAGEPVTPASTAAAPAPAAPAYEPQAAPASREPAMAEQPAEQENVEIAQATTPAPTAPAATPTPAAEPTTQEQPELPRTASPFPLLGLLGGLALAMGAILKSFAKESS
ncbi:MAG: hypothetical protein A3F68_08445 [Acidobacteria bacterium RIFCSPLOWO2_12_FULL_54_10]|nr:MAG: hypothetical protein A3F68_08445 [Acidobacteria bacterium RIFCSPLOWO2_12_FULL_54_10]